MYRTVLHIEYSRTRLLKKSSLKETRSQPSQNIWLSCVHTHSKREKNKIRSFRKEGYFLGYSESSKAYRIYFPGYKKIDISRDVNFDEDTTYNKSRKRPAEEPEKEKAPRVHDTTMNEEEAQEED